MHPIEAGLTQQTRQMVDARLRLKEDNCFLRHYASVAEAGAAEQMAQAQEVSQAVGAQASTQMRLQEELRELRTKLAMENAALQGSRDVQRGVAIALASLQQRAGADLGALRGRLALEANALREAAYRSASLRQAVAAARSEVLTVESCVHSRKRQAEDAEAALAKVRAEGATREDVVQSALRDTLARLEADFAKDRARQENHLMAMEGILRGAATPVALAISAPQNTSSAPSLQKLRALRNSLGDTVTGSTSTATMEDSGAVAVPRLDPRSAPDSAMVPNTGVLLRDETDLQLSEASLEADNHVGSAEDRRSVAVAEHIAALARRCPMNPGPTVVPSLDEDTIDSTSFTQTATSSTIG